MRSIGVTGSVLLSLCACGGGSGSGGWNGADTAYFVAGATSAVPAVYADSMFVGWFGSDGRRDLLIVGSEDSTGLGVVPCALQTGKGRGDGSFDFGVPSIGAAARDTTAPDAVVGHFNLDAFVDVVVFENLGPQMGAVVCYGRGDGTFVPATPVPVALGTDVQTVAVTDANGDYFDDLVFGNYFADVGFVVSDGNGGWAAPVVVPLPVYANVARVTSADVDADGDLDVLAFQSSGRVTILHNDGGGGLQIATSMSVGSFTDDMIVDDPYDPQYIAIFGMVPVPHVSIYPKDANDSFEDSTSHRVDLTADVTHIFGMTSILTDPAQWRRVVLIGVNGVTGDTHLFFVRPETTEIEAEIVPFGSGKPIRFAVGDLNGDAFQDLVVSTFWIEGTGSSAVFHGALESALSTGR